jgi:hypothetical protein
MLNIIIIIKIIKTIIRNPMRINYLQKLTKIHNKEKR